jgi:hypothetical protein
LSVTSDRAIAASQKQSKLPCSLRNKLLRRDDIKNSDRSSIKSIEWLQIHQKITNNLAKVQPESKAIPTL